MSRKTTNVYQCQRFYILAKYRIFLIYHSFVDCRCSLQTTLVVDCHPRIASLFWGIRFQLPNSHTGNCAEMRSFRCANWLGSLALIVRQSESAKGMRFWLSRWSVFQILILSTYFLLFPSSIASDFPFFGLCIAHQLLLFIWWHWLITRPNSNHLQ